MMQRKYYVYVNVKLSRAFPQQFHARAPPWITAVRDFIVSRQQALALQFLLGDFGQGIFDVAAAVPGWRGAERVWSGSGAVAGRCRPGHRTCRSGCGSPTATGPAACRAGPASGARSRAVDAVAAIAQRADDALVFVETNRAWRNVELAREFGDGPGRHERLAVYVNVNYDELEGVAYYRERGNESGTSRNAVSVDQTQPEPGVAPRGGRRVKWITDAAAVRPGPHQPVVAA